MSASLPTETSYVYVAKDHGEPFWFEELTHVQRARIRAYVQEEIAKAIAEDRGDRRGY